jgi:type I restriction enzyme S subunit
MSEWTESTVRSVISHIASGPSPTCEERNASGPEWGLLKTTAVTWNGWNENAHKVPPPEFWGQGRLEVRHDDVIITKAGPRNRVGVVVHVPRTRPGLMVSGKMVLLRPDESKVLPRLLADVLASPPAQKYLDDRTTGMAEAQTNFANSALLSTPLLLPPLDEQRRIAEILDTTDETIQATECVVAKLEALRVAALHQLFANSTGRVTSLREIATLRGGHGFPDNEQGAKEGEFPFYKVSDMNTPGNADRLHRANHYVGRDALRRNGWRLFPAGSVVFAKVGAALLSNRRRILTVDSIIDNNMMAAIPKEAVSTAWLHLWLQTVDLGEVVQVGALPSVNQTIVGSVRLQVPSAEEQRRQVGVLDAHGIRIRSERSEVDKFRRVRDGLAADLLSGRMRTVVA